MKSFARAKANGRIDLNAIVIEMLNKSFEKGESRIAERPPTSEDKMPLESRWWDSYNQDLYIFRERNGLTRWISWKEL